MSDVYTVSMANVTVVADATLVIIHSASAITSRASTLDVLRVTVNQNISSTSQQLGVILAQKASAFGTYVSATPSPRVIGGNASGITGGTAGAAGTAGVNASAEGAGTVTTILSEGFNNLSGYIWVPTPEERILIPLDTAFIVKLRGTPSTLTNWNCNVTFREIN
jgi:hypothetical protein